MLMTVAEVASYLRVTERTVYRLLKKDGIPAVKVGRQWRFERDSIDAWLERSLVRSRMRILVIEDNEIIAALFRETLEEQGHSVMAAKSSSQGLKLVKGQDFDLVFLDLRMPGMDGAELFRQIKTVKPDLAVTITTGYPDSEMMVRALAQGPFGVMSKPFAESDIVDAVSNFLRFTPNGR